MKSDDEMMMNRIVRRDGGALEALYRTHAGAVLAYARHTVMDLALADDVVQEVFVRLWEQPAGFDSGRGSLRNYLFLQARSRSIEMIRSMEARRERERRHARRQHNHVDVESRVVLKDEHAAVRAALCALGEDERAAIELAFYGGLSYRDVAVALAVPEGTVKSRIRAGLQRLAPTLRGLPPTVSFPLAR